MIVFEVYPRHTLLFPRKCYTIVSRYEHREHPSPVSFQFMEATHADTVIKINDAFKVVKNINNCLMKTLIYFCAFSNYEQLF